MADIKLTRPAAGQNVVIPSAPDARMVLDFSADQVSIDRPQGSDSLFFRFDDGSSIELQNFYTQYNKDAIPSFEVDGQLIAGADFFNAFGPDLAPAAGPSASPTRSGRYRDFANAGLEHGVNHLDGLDYRLSFAGDTPPNINPYASPFLTNAAPTLSTGGAAIAIGLTERAWRGTGDNAAPDSQRGSFSVADPDGDSLTTTVSMGGKVVAVSTAGPTTVASDYGILVITPTGGGSNITFTYIYTLKQDPNSPTDSLAEGEKQADNIVFSISDGQGHTVTQPINVVITGSNDAPDITGVSGPLGLTEDGEYANGDRQADGKLYGKSANDAVAGVFTDSGDIIAQDPDHGNNLTFGLVTSSGTLNVGDKIGTLTHGGVETDITITAISSASPDGTTPLVISTVYGDLTLNVKTGHYDFALKHDAKGATDVLTEGDTVSLTLVPTVHDQGASDGNAAVTRQDANGHSTTVNSLGIVIHGTNDAPVIDTTSWTAGHNSSGIGIVQEDISGAQTVTGSITAADADSGETTSLRYGFVHNDGGQNYSVTPLYVKAEADGTAVVTSEAPPENNVNHDGYYGTLTMSADGKYTFSLYSESNSVQRLGEGETKNFSVDVVAEDIHGAYNTATVQFQIVGTNDAPVVTSADPITVQEAGFADQHDATLGANQAFAGTVTATGAVHATDMDHGDTLSYSVTAADGMTKTTGSFTVAGDTTTYDTACKVATGTLYFSTSSGKYVFELNNDAVNHLAQGDSQNVTFGVDVTDSLAHTPTTITLTIKGTNDRPTLSLSDSTPATTENTKSFTGQALGGDSDDRHQLTYGLAMSDANISTDSVEGMKLAFNNNTTGNGVNTLTGKFGTLTISTNGEYTYTVDKTTGGEADSLAEGETGQDSFIIYVRDEYGAWNAQPLTVTITGNNDAPVVGSVTPLNVVESGVTGANHAVAGTATAAGAISATDVDHNAQLSYSVTAASGGSMTTATGSFHVDGDTTTYDTTYTVATGTLYFSTTSGKYAFVLNNNAVNHLALGDSQIVTFDVDVTDSLAHTPTTIALTITGTNDIPSLSIAAGTNGTAENGSVAYSVNEDTKVSGTFTVQDPDSDGTDGAVKTGFDGGHRISLQLDADNSSASGAKTPQSSVNVGYPSPEPGNDAYIFTTYGKLTVNTGGTYTFEPNGNANALDQGDTVSMQFNVTLTDAHGAYDTKTISITLKGTEDAPTISHTTADKGTLKLVESALRVENPPANDFNKASAGTESATGSFTVKDVDAHDTQSVVLYIGNTISSGVTTYEAVKWTDLSVSASGVITYKTEYGELTITPTDVSKVDASNGLVLTPSSVGKGITYTYTYKLDNVALDSKNADFSKDYSFKIEVTDSQNASVSQNFGVHIQGANDIPLISDSKVSVTEDGVLFGSNAKEPGKLSSDTMRLPATHDQSYDQDNAKDDLTFGVVGLQKSDQSAWQAAGAKVSTVSATTTGAASHAVTQEILGTYTDGNAHSYVVTNYGVLDINTKTGDYTFTLGTDTAALTKSLENYGVTNAGDVAKEISKTVNALPQGEHMDLNFAATVKDTGGLTGAATITVTINGTNDQPSLTLVNSSTVAVDSNGHATISMKEDVNIPVTGTVTVDDPDMGDTKAFGVLQSSSTIEGLLAGSSAPSTTTSIVNDYGTLTIDSEGNYTFTLNNGSAAVQGLGDGGTHSETYYVVVKDASGAFDIKPVTVTITGKDDPTVLNTHGLTPDQNLVEAGVKPVTSGEAALAAQKYNDNTAGVSSAYGYIGAYDADTADNTALNSTDSSAALHYVIKVGTAECDLNKMMAGTGLQTGTASIDLSNGVVTLTNGGSTSSLAVGEAARLSDTEIVIKLENGSLVIREDSSKDDTDGNTSLYKYTYYVDNTDTDVQKLNFHETTTDSFTVEIVDSNSNSVKDSSPVTVTIEGTNDRPTLTVLNSSGDAAAATMVENGTSVSGIMHVADAEQTNGAESVSSGFNFSLVADANSTSNDTSVMQGTYGRLVLDQATGNYTYYRTADLTGLNNGDTLTETFYVRVQDADGAYSSVMPITINITGVDQPGTMTNTLTSPALVEDGVTGTVQGILHYTSEGKLGANTAQALSPANGIITGSLSVSDPDNNLGANNKELATNGHAESYGNYTYGAEVNDVWNSSATVTLPGGGTETISNTGSINAPVYVVPGYGTLTATSQGTYEFVVDKTSASFNALAKGETVTISVPASTSSTTDADGTVHGNLTVTITGTNDAPVIQNVPTTVVKNVASDTEVTDWQDDFAKHSKNTACHDNPSNFRTYMHSEDSDELKSMLSTEAHRVLDLIGKDPTWSGVGKWNNLRVSHQSWLLTALYKEGYTFDWNALKDFANVESTNNIDSFVYNYSGLFTPGGSIRHFLKSPDGREVVRGYLSDSTTVEGVYNAITTAHPYASGSVAQYATDVDHNDKLTFFAVKNINADPNKVEGDVVQSIKGIYGTLVIQANGNYTYVLDYGATPPSGVAETFQIYVRDTSNAVAETTIPLVIVVTPANGSDGGSSSSMCLHTGVGTVEEDGTLTVASKVGNGNDLGLHLKGRYMEDPDGSGSQQAVPKGENGDTRSVTTDYGTLVLLPNGSYTYVLNNDSPKVQQLTATDTITQTFKVVNGNGSTSLTITIKGTNDAPTVISQSDTVSLHQLAGATTWVADDATGSFKVGDIDSGEQAKLKLISSDTTLITAGTDAGHPGYDYMVTTKAGGTFYIKANDGTGTFTYTYKAPEGNYNGIATDSAEITVADLYDGTTTVTISSSLDAKNDAPVFDNTKTVTVNGVEHVVLPNTPQVTEDGGTSKLTATGKVAATDPDAHIGSISTDHLTYALLDEKGSVTDLVTHANGTLIMETNGTYTFRLNNSSAAVQALGAGKTLEETFTVQVSDGNDGITTAELVVTINGTNDAPVLSLYAGDSAVSGSGSILHVTDGSESLTVSGKAIAHDIDTSDTLYLHLTDFTQKHPGTSSTSITYGDTPNSFITQLVYAKEDHGVWTQTSNSSAVKMGTFVLCSDGSYKFMGDKDGIAQLGQGDKLNVSVGIGVDDGHNSVDEGTITVSITGTNTAPVITGFTNTVLDDVAPLSGAEYTAPVLTGLVGAKDVDGDSASTDYYIKSGDSLVRELSNDYGTLKIEDGGRYTFTLNAKGEALLRSLGTNETLYNAKLSTFDFTVVVKDQYNATGTDTLHIDLKGINDTPTVSNYTASLSVTDKEVTSQTEHITAADLDAHDTLSYAVLDTSDNLKTSVTGDYGTLTINATTGEYSYTADSRAAALGIVSGTAEKATESFTIRVSDGHNGYVDKTVEVTVTGTNDAPSITEATAPGATSGSFAFTDVDANDVHTLYVTLNGQSVEAVVDNGTYMAHTQIGDFTFTKLGSDTTASGEQWSYSFAADSALAATMRDGTHSDYSISLGVDDGHGIVNAAAVTITVDGTNHAPVADTITDALLFGHVPATDEENDQLHYQVSTDGTHGHLTIGDDGSYTYALNTSESALADLRRDYDSSTAGHVTDDVTFTVTDGHENGTEATHGSLTIDLYNGAALDSNGGQLLFADGSFTDTTTNGTGHNDIILGGSHDDTLYGGGGDDILYGGGGDDILYGGAGNDHLYGGAGNDHLYGGTGNNFLDGGTGVNTLMGGDGNDILVHHTGDTIDGGKGIDVLLTDDSTNSLDTLLSSAKNVEVAIKGTDTANDSAPMSLTDISKLAAVGININDTDHGTEMSLSSDWKPGETHTDGTHTYTTFTNASANLTLNTSMTETSSQDATEAAKFVLQTT